MVLYINLRSYKNKREKMYCKKCGNELQDEWKVCPNCGEPVNNAGQNTESCANKDDESGLHKKLKFYREWPFWMIIIVIFAIVVFLLISIMRENKDITGNNEGIKEKTEKTEEKEVEPVTDFSDQDFSTLFDKTEADLENSGLIENEDTGEYSALEGNLLVKIKDGQVNEIVITGDEKTAPVFDTVELGTTGDEAKTKLAAGYPESQDFTDGFKLLNLDTKGSVECTLTEDKVSKIRYIQLSDEEIEAFNAAKEEKLRAEYIFPDSDKKYLSEDEIRTKTVDEMIIGRNEIFARHGYIFTDENLKNHFESTSWYEGTIPAEQFNSDQVFNDFEKKNIELIKSVEDEINGISAPEVTETEEDEFIGMSGTYVCTDSDLFHTGRIEIYRTGNTADFTLGALQMNYDLITGSAEIINSNTIQINSYGAIITCTWSDSKHMYVTNSDVYEGMDGAALDDTTNGRNYVYSVEFSQ